MERNEEDGPETSTGLAEVPADVATQRTGRVAALQQALDIAFTDQALVREALTHRSYLNEIDHARPSNERLEFLGDAVLGLVSADFLFHTYSEFTEGQLTSLRSALVRTEALARYGEEIDLGRFLFLGRGEELAAGRQRPSGLACAFEALLAAIYLDQGYDAARDFALGFLRPEAQAVLAAERHKNAKSSLQELLQARHQVTPTYHVVSASGPDHAKQFTVEVRRNGKVLGRGEARSKRAAEQEAAERALDVLEADGGASTETAQ